MYYYHYYVEGECEERLINSYKIPPFSCFKPGKVEVFNFIQKRISNQRLLTLNRNTIVILIYDIDVEKTEVLDDNIKKLNEFGFKVYHIQSIRNFEDEIVYSTDLKNINEMFNTESADEFKNYFIHQDKLVNRLKKEHFRIEKIWSRVNKKSPFNKYSKEESLKFIKTQEGH